MKWKERKRSRKRDVLLLKQVFSLSYVCCMTTIRSMQWTRPEKALTLISQVLEISVPSPGQRVCLSEGEIFGLLRS